MTETHTQHTDKAEGTTVFFSYSRVDVKAALPIIAAIEQACGREAIKTLHPMQAGDVPTTWADASLLRALIGQRTPTPLTEGIQQFVDWYRDYYQV